MGTRGFLGFVVDGTEKIQYNHSDSYPSGLGVDVLSWVRANNHALTCDVHRGERGGPVDLARELRVVDPQSEPTDADIERLVKWTNTGVGGQKDRPDWYQLLRETQGDPGRILSAGYIEDASGFPTDSLFAEWGYIVDLDVMTFEAYRGFQHSAHDKGRFADRQGRDMSNGYHPCALVALWPLTNLPSDDEFVQALEGTDEEDED